MAPTIRTTPFEAWHLKLFKTGEYYHGGNLNPEYRSMAYRNVKGVTLLIDDEIAAIMGIAPVWSGVGEVTLIPSELFYKNIRHCVKFVRQIIEFGIEYLNLHRLQGTTLAEHPKHGRFMEFLGFEFEGLLKGYGPDGADHRMYRWRIQ